MVALDGKAFLPRPVFNQKKPAASTDARFTNLGATTTTCAERGQRLPFGVLLIQLSAPVGSDASLPWLNQA